MSQKNNNDTKIIAFAVGAIVGSIAALLFAPFSGKKMRKLTEEKSKNLYGEAKKKYTEVEPHLNKAKEKGIDLMNKTREKLSQKGDEINVKATSVKDNLSKSAKGLGSKIKFKVKKDEE